MKLPEKIKGRNRIRDAEIVLLWERYELPTEKIAEKFKITQRRIEQILRANHAFVEIDKDWEKKKRIHWLKSQLKKRGDTSRDSIDIQDFIRKEIEGDSDKSRGPGETKVIIVYPEGFKKNEDPAQRLSSPLSIVE